MMENVNGLLKPRYLVIADYPFSKNRIGDILEIVEGRNEIWDNCRTGKRENIAPMDYPAIFRKLHWWEHREESEMPEYVKGLKSVRKLLEIEDHGGEFPSVLTEGDIIWSLILLFMPATKEEYTHYTNNKKESI